MLISQLDPADLSDEQMTELLFGLQDDGAQGDCIFVPGSSKCVEYRVPLAVELYRRSRAPKLLFSGGRTWLERGQSAPEAILMQESARDLGVPQAAMLVETKSLSTKENVMESAQVLERVIGLAQVSRLILVATAFHMRRLHLTMRTYLPANIAYSCCPADDHSTRKDNWWLSDKGRRRVHEEARKLIAYVKSGQLIDDTMPDLPPCASAEKLRQETGKPISNGYGGL